MMQEGSTESPREPEDKEKKKESLLRNQLPQIARRPLGMQALLDPPKFLKMDA